MKRYFEIFLVIFVLFTVIYTIVYLFYFDSLCWNYSWVNEQYTKVSISKLATCKDSIVCEASDIEVNIKNELTGWNCTKKDSWLFWKEIFMSIFNNFKNSIIK